MHTKYGIPSFTTQSKQSQTRSTKEQDKINYLAENDTEESITDGLSDHKLRDCLISEIFDGLSEDWRVLFPHIVKGQCLDLYCGFGKRSILLSEYADSVTAIDPNLNKLRLLYASNHHLRKKVYPVHADLDSIPFASNTFDTIVFNSDGRTDFSNVIPILCDLLTDSGSLFCKLNGVPREFGITSRFELDCKQSDFWDFKSVMGATLGNYHKIISNGEFDTIEFFSLFPTKEKSRNVFHIDDKRAMRRAINMQLSNFSSTRIPQWLSEKSIKHLANHPNFFRGLLPNYLAVATRDPSLNPLSPCEKSRNTSDEIHGKLLIRGQRRVTILHLSSGGIEKIEKRPKHTRCTLTDQKGRANRNETSIIKRLRESDDTIAEYLPEGYLRETPFGPVRFEFPVSGNLIRQSITDDSDDFRSSLQTAFDWLSKFHTAIESKPTKRNPSEVKEDLTCTEYNIYGQRTCEPVTLSRGPTHGDFSPDNIFVDQKANIENIIDWETADLSGLQVVDVSTCLLTFAKTAFGGFESGVKKALMKDNPYSNTVSEVLDSYCNSVEVSPTAILTYLPYPYVRSLNSAIQTQSTLRFTWGQYDPAKRAQFLNNNISTIKSNIL